MNRRGLGAAALATLLLGGLAWLWWLSRAPAGTDAQQILAQIQRGQQAVGERNAGALMRLVSPHYRDENGFTRPALSYAAMQQFRTVQRIEIAIPLNDLRIQVAPNRLDATSTGRVELRVSDSEGAARDLTLNLTIQWRKEPVRHYLLFPAEEWRVIRAAGIEPID